ncbi:MAG: hypothetical protein Q7R96_04420 [Nanoarchaeota archaeon]|nr:hypothetical protein [Nanoarchaeota archaeon]
MNIYVEALLQELPKLFLFLILISISFLAGTIIKRYTKEELTHGKKYLSLTQNIITSISFIFLLIFFYREATTFYFISMLIILPVLAGISLYLKQPLFYHTCALAILPEFLLLPALALSAGIITGSTTHSWKHHLPLFIVGVIIGLGIRFTFILYGFNLALA